MVLQLRGRQLMNSVKLPAISVLLTEPAAEAAELADVADVAEVTVGRNLRHA
jgi:hypothetical protein